MIFRGHTLIQAQFASHPMKPANPLAACSGQGCGWNWEHLPPHHPQALPSPSSFRILDSMLSFVSWKRKPSPAGPNPFCAFWPERPSGRHPDGSCGRLGVICPNIAPRAPGPGISSRSAPHPIWRLSVARQNLADKLPSGSAPLSAIDHPGL